MKTTFKAKAIVGALLLVVSTNSYALCGIGEAKRNLNQGMLYANMNDFGNAVNSFKASIECKKTSEAYSNLGVSYMQLGKNNLALDALKKAENKNARDGVVLYNLAAVYSVSNQVDIALLYLDKALNNGFSHYDAIRFDPDLSNLRGEPEFRSILEKHKVFIQ